MKETEPWFLLTNIPVSKMTKQQILRTYAKRFEIENTSKILSGLKRYEWHQIRKLSVLELFLMLSLGVALAASLRKSGRSFCGQE